MSGKFALIIGNTEYSDAGLAQLAAPGKDAEKFARILKDPKLCGFDEVDLSLNQPSSAVIEAIDEFFAQRGADDLLVLYFSGHGVRDELGSLYLAFKNTLRSRLRSTAIKSDYIREAMDQSRSKRQILILDCCNSGAFPQGTKAEVGGPMGMTTAFQGYGRYVLTASDSTQFAWEGEQVIGETDYSLFTHYLVKGLEGEADDDGDGTITVDELYDYAFAEISKVTPRQTPTKSASKQEGEIVLRQITRMDEIKALALPYELIQTMGDWRAFVRQGAVQELEKLLNGKNLGLARSAKEALEKMAAEDDSNGVRQAAARALGSASEAVQEPRTEPVSPQRIEDAAPKTGPLPPSRVAGVVPKTGPLPAQPTEEPEPVQRQTAPQPVIAPPQQAVPEVVAPVMENRPAVGSQSAARMPSARLLILGGIGALAVLGMIFGALSTTNQKLQPTAPATNTLQAISSSAAVSSTQAIPVTSSTEIPAVKHLLKPEDVVPAPKRPTYDADSSGTGPEGRAPYGDLYRVDRFERPFLKDMTYVPDLDITNFSLTQDDNWTYIAMTLVGTYPNNTMGIHYGVEIDLNDDGFGDYLLWGQPPYSTDWSTSNVRVFKDTNHDTGGRSAAQSDAVLNGDGYDTLLFHGGTTEDADPDLVWMRTVEGLHATIQFAFKKSWAGPGFAWGVVADAGLKEVSKFDYNDRITEADAGSPVRSLAYYPLGSLYAVDNSCWEIIGIPRTGNEPKLCPPVPPDVSKKPNKKPGVAPTQVCGNYGCY